jgi:hypothetical protein
MSVVVIARFPSDDTGKALEWARAHADIPEDITAHAKTLGQIGHRILLGDTGVGGDRRVAQRGEL